MRWMWEFCLGDGQGDMAGQNILAIGRILMTNSKTSLLGVPAGSRVSLRSMY